jgi:beta-glucosidase
MSSSLSSPVAPGSATLRFPADFQFGAATAAHQVEGGNDQSDWWDFELIPGHIADSSRSGLACDHYHRFREDLDLLRALNLTTYRFSVEWARIEPEPGRFDTAAIEHYLDVIDACRSRGIEPFVTLYHFTLPRWFAARGGWLASDAPAVFGRFVRAVAQSLASRVTLWVTLNEPIVYLYQGFLEGVWPPGKNDVRKMALAGRNLIRAHLEAYQILHSRPGFGGEPPQVGLAKHLRIFDPAREGNRLDSIAATAQEASFNWAFLDSLHRGRFMPPFGLGEPIPGAVPAQDFIGMNYYSRGRVRFAPSQPGTLFGLQGTTPGAPLNDLGWEIYPEGITRLLRTVHRRYNRPIWITENGIADATDRRRPAFIVHHLAQIARAIGEGIPVRGYYHWSLIDNFEWAEGFSARFGLYTVNYANQTRTLRPSGALYGQIAAERALRAGWLEQYPLLP